MIFNIVTLFFVAIAGGGLVVFLSKKSNSSFPLGVAFGGAYLFSITIMHILPELFSAQNQHIKVGLYVLIGFFLQKVLELFSSGVEHGHFHVHEGEHGHSVWSPLPIVIALSIHALLEGSLLAHPSTIQPNHNSTALLFGIAVHKIPAAFALMSVVTCYVSKKRTALVYLLIFALASPLGLVLSDITFEAGLFSSDVFIILFALASGNFLHISTTIVFESSPGHKLNMKRFGVTILGVLLGILSEFLIEIF